MSRGGFTDDAHKFAQENGIHTIDGEALLELIIRLDPIESRILLERITDGDYMTPTCANCGIKLVPRSIESEKPFWRCRNWKPYGKGCNTKMLMTSEQMVFVNECNKVKIDCPFTLVRLPGQHKIGEIHRF